MSTKKIDQLMEKYFAETATPAEEAMLFQLIAQEKWEKIDEELEKVWDNYVPEATMPAEQALKIFSVVQDKSAMTVQPAKIYYRRTFLRWAAAILVLLSGSTYLLLSRHQTAVREEVAVSITADVQPGSNKAFLTLADGTVVPLDSTGNQVIQVGNTAIRQQNGQLSYNIEGAAAASRNILTAPRGGQFRVVLSDGTKVWLNADSRLTYPTAFTGNKRVVALQGEAYFEVQHNPERPFHVVVNDVDITVLGTHFNVNAYPDEKVLRTALLEGAIGVSKGSVTKRLKAGELATIAEDNNVITISDANGDAAIAWKNGYFHFEKAAIGTVMRQLGRWYNVNIIYEGEMPTRFFQGEIQRNLPLSGVIHILEKNGIHCRLEGNQLRVLP